MSDTADMAAPDVAGPVIAYRAWWANGDDLRSMAMQRHVWQPGEDHEASCTRSVLFATPHGAPAPGCQCGFYVMHTLDDLLNEPTQIAKLGINRLVVAGEVEVWGHSERYERGRRVQWCRIRSLYDTPLAGDVDIGALAERYGVPVVADDGTIAAWKQNRPKWLSIRPATVSWTFSAPNSSHRHHVHFSYHARPVAQPPVAHARQIADAYRDAVHNTMKLFTTELAKAAQSLYDGFHQDQTRDPDKPIPSPPKDHLRLAQQRPPRSMHPSRTCRAGACPGVNPQRESHRCATRLTPPCVVGILRADSLNGRRVGTLREGRRR